MNKNFTCLRSGASGTVPDKNQFKNPRELKRNESPKGSLALCRNRGKASVTKATFTLFLHLNFLHLFRPSLLHQTEVIVRSDDDVLNKFDVEKVESVENLLSKFDI